MPGRTPSWYSDPDDPALARWHDGQDWTEFTMVVATWTSKEPPPPPAGWTPPVSPTAGLTPAFGASAPAPPPVDPEATPEPAPEPPVERYEPEGSGDADGDAGTDPGAPDDDPSAATATATSTAPSTPEPPGEEPRGLARLTDEPGTRAFGGPGSAPEGGPEPSAPGTRAFGGPVPATDPSAPGTRAFGGTPTAPTTPEPTAPGTRAFGGAPTAPTAQEAGPEAVAPADDDPSTSDDLLAPGGVHIDAPTAGPDPDEDVDDEDVDFDGGAGPISGSVQAIGPEAPGIDWGVGPEALKPVRRPSGWHLDEDGNPIEEPVELPRRTLVQQYGHLPVWARIAIPLVVIGLVALAVTSVLGGGDGDGDDGTDLLFSTRDGTLDEETLDEAGMDDALTRARERGVPAEINDRDLSGLIKGVCTAARRSLVSLDLSQELVDTGLEVGELGEAATAIGNGSLEYCPDQEAALGQVVSVLITRTQRMLSTSTTT